MQNAATSKLDESSISKYVFWLEWSEFKFTRKERLGKGSYGSVFKYCLEKLNKYVALKVLIDHGCISEAFAKEVENLVRLQNHDNIVKFFGITRDPASEAFYMVLQLANDGNLRDYLETHIHKLGWLDKIRMAKEIASGINHLHSNKIVHRWNDQQIQNHVTSGKRETPINGTPDDFKNLYFKAWDGSPDLRPTIKEIYVELDKQFKEIYVKLGEDSNLKGESELRNNKLKSSNDRIQQLEEEVLKLKGELDLSNNKERELLGKIESLRREAANCSSEHGEAINFKFGDHDSNNIGQLLNDIKQLKKDLESFCTLGKSQYNIASIEKLLKKYNCLGKVKFPEDLNLVEGLFQRYIVETIIKKAENYLKLEGTNKAAKRIVKDKLLDTINLSLINDLASRFSNVEHLEVKINYSITQLQDYTDLLLKNSIETDKVSSAIPIMLRQLVYALLSDRGFSQINDKDKNEQYEHPFILSLADEIKKEMNDIRKINKETRRKIESKTTEIVRKIIVIFLFQFKVQEPEVQYVWFDNNDKINPEFMELSIDNEELNKAKVNICSFPLIITNYGKPNYKVILKASIAKKASRSSWWP
ncbi:10321_t:CDS:2 [Gigaspora margarita]|uniref:10321_t:CDS:1 n=1 Tax=Gigaspora margarita TaxID=4874 RepID=A0ABN7V9U6_GIGMA|nr:10321_t:CDS:2 [Gigaspora margarita]